MEIAITLGVPQIIMLSFYVIALVTDVKHHGETKVTKCDARITLSAIIIGFLLLNWGGFF